MFLMAGAWKSTTYHYIFDNALSFNSTFYHGSINERAICTPCN